MKAWHDAQTSGNNNWTGVTAGIVYRADPGPTIETWALASDRQPHFFHALEHQMAAFEAEHLSALRDVRINYVLPLEDCSVSSFLTEHRTMSQLLIEAIPHLKECFGEDAIFGLRILVDEAGSRTLYAVVMWPGAVIDVRNALCRFDETWWLAHSRQAAGHLVFTYELV
jgi:hypothetical protein